MHYTLLTQRSMALAVYIMHGLGPNNEIHTQLHYTIVKPGPPLEKWVHCMVGEACKKD